MTHFWFFLEKKPRLLPVGAAECHRAWHRTCREPVRPGGAERSATPGIWSCSLCFQKKEGPETSRNNSSRCALDCSTQWLLCRECELREEWREGRRVGRRRLRISLLEQLPDHPRVCQITQEGQAELPVESWLSPPAHRPGSFLWALAILNRAVGSPFAKWKVIILLFIIMSLWPRSCKNTIKILPERAGKRNWGNRIGPSLAPVGSRDAHLFAQCSFPTDLLPCNCLWEPCHCFKDQLKFKLI